MTVRKLHMYQKNHGLIGHGMQLNLELSLQYQCLLSREITNSIADLAPEVQNYVFMGIVGLSFLHGILELEDLFSKKKILRNSYENYERYFVLSVIFAFANAFFCY